MNANTPDQQAAEASTEITVQGVFATVGYDGFVKSLFNRSGDLSKDFAHATLGVATEIFELLHATDHINAVEEGGDLVFYETAARQVLNDWRPGFLLDADEKAVEAAYDVRLDGMTTVQGLRHCVNELLDIAKRWVGYGKEPESALKCMVYLGTAGRLAQDLSLLRGRIPQEQLMIINVAKLLARYKGMTFNASHAVNRDLSAERQVLEDASS